MKYNSDACIVVPIAIWAWRFIITVRDWKFLITTRTNWLSNLILMLSISVHITQHVYHTTSIYSPGTHM